MCLSQLSTGPVLRVRLVMTVALSAVLLKGYEKLKPLLLSLAAGRDSQQSEASETELFVVAFLAGAGAGSLASVVTHPFDVVKTRIQVEMYSSGAGQNESTGGTFTQFRHIVRNEGFSTLFTGLLPRLAKVAPACAIMISCYELGKRFFRTRGH